MELITRGLNLFFVSVGVLVASLLFIGKIERRKLCVLKYFLCVAVFFGVCIFLSWLKNEIMGNLDGESGSTGFFIATYIITVITHCIIFAICIASMYVIFNVKLVEALFVGSAAYALQSIALGLFSIFMKLLGFDYQFNIQDLALSPVNLFSLLAMYVIVYVSAYFLCVRRYERETAFINKIWIFLIIINLTNIFMNSASVPPNEENVAVRLYMILLFGKVMLCISGFIIQFILSDYYRLQVRQLALNRVMEQQKAQFEIAKENLDKVNVNAHDLRRQISIILQSVGENGVGSVEAQLKDIEKELNIADTAFHTGNKALDITVTEKARDCIGKSIKLSVIADGTCIDKLDDLDIYMLFGNLLDNAIEAAERVEDAENRIISFTLNKNRDCMVCHIENTFSIEPEFVKGVPQTIKKDKRFHGFGVKSIKNIVFKYGGTVNMKISHGMFCVDILIPS